MWAYLVLVVVNRMDRCLDALTADPEDMHHTIPKYIDKVNIIISM
jgi:translation elongation factor EF-G